MMAVGVAGGSRHQGAGGGVWQEFCVGGNRNQGVWK